MHKRTTIADVARAGNVSMMTVSRAINNKPGLSQELRQKILDLAAEMNYLPNKIARGLATRRMATVGLVVPSIINPFYAAIALGVENIAYENGYNVFLINTSADLEREQAALDSLWTQDIDGAILCSMRLPYRKLIKNLERFPAVVLFNRQCETPLPNVATICVNDRRAAQEKVAAMIGQGRRRIACISASRGDFSGTLCLDGYMAALKSARIRYDPNLVAFIIPSLENGSQAAGQLLADCPDIDAILAFNDMVAIGALQACKAAGKLVPGQVAIFGADDIPLASIIEPQLSTSRLDLVDIGQLSMRLLLEMFAGELAQSAYTVEPELVLRETA